jgi:hypothetical protein
MDKKCILLLHLYLGLMWGALIIIITHPFFLILSGLSVKTFITLRAAAPLTFVIILCLLSPTIVLFSHSVQNSDRLFTVFAAPTFFSVTSRRGEASSLDKCKYRKDSSKGQSNQ